MKIDSYARYINASPKAHIIMVQHFAWDVLMQLDTFWSCCGKHGFLMRRLNRQFRDMAGDLSYPVRCIYAKTKISRAAGGRLFKVPPSILRELPVPILFPVLYDFVLKRAGGLSGIADLHYMDQNIWRDEFTAIVEMLRRSVGFSFKGIQEEAAAIIARPKTRGEWQAHPFKVVSYYGWYRVVRRE